MELNKLGVIEANKKYIDGEFSAVEMVNACIESIKEHADKNAVIEVFDDAICCAEKLDAKREAKEKLGKLAGTVVLVKDNILVKGKKATASSNFLKNFESIYSATVVNKMLSEDAIILGRTNMDEFAMGSDGSSSIYGKTKNAIDDNYSAGGSSSGSAVAVKLNDCTFALGTDTGGSIRFPASYNGVCGVKPTYGTVSRNGVYAYASSFNQVGPITKNAKDSAYVLEIIAGVDQMDMTTLNYQAYDFSSLIGEDVSGKVYAVEKNISSLIKDKECESYFNALVDFIKAKGGVIKEIEIDNILRVGDVYKLVAYAEASSNLSRYDGLKYTTQAQDCLSAQEIYVKSRSQGFGKEVKKRIMLGNYILSKKEVYAKAKNLQQLIINSYNEKMQGVDCLLLPTSFGVAPKASENRQECILGVLANVLRAPSISIPYAKNKEGLPLGVQIMAKELDEKKIYQLAVSIEKNYGEVR
ncbi:MAG: aspartyl/glutamyl-tRNA amidotransferase subunit A [Clostridia bacterium]|nr:aspartyl/glutamyl-tRNA amidotransferase subunit A [Clostridia bacterium]